MNTILIIIAITYLGQPRLGASGLVAIGPIASPQGQHGRVAAAAAVCSFMVDKYYKNSSLWSRPPVVAFAALDGAPAPVELLQRVRRLTGVKVRPSSEAKSGQEITDRPSGHPGLLFSISGVEWLGPERARVTGSYTRSRRASLSASYFLVLVHHRWRVRREEVRTVS